MIPQRYRPSSGTSDRTFHPCLRRGQSRSRAPTHATLGTVTGHALMIKFKPDWVVCNSPRAGRIGVELSMMSNGGSGKTESVIPFEPKLNLRSEAADPLDAAGRTILDVLRQAAAAAEQATNRRAKSLTSYRLKF